MAEEAQVTSVHIPAGHGRAVEVRRGEVLRISVIEGPQVADATFLSLDNYREGFHVGQSVALNMIAGTGSMHHLTTLYSAPPHERPMMTVVEDTVGRHFAWNGGRCTRGIFASRDGVHDRRRSCQDNLAEAIRPWGLCGQDVADVLNVFQAVDIVDDRELVFLPSPAVAGDHVDLRAEMDLLAAVSACPSEASATNGHRAKPMRLEVFADRIILD